MKKTHLRDEQAEDVEEAIHSAEAAATGVTREITSEPEDDEMQELSQATS